MSLLFRYKVYPVPHAIHSLGGRWSRPHPRIIVSVIGPRKTVPSEGLLDTGADDTVFPGNLASFIGIDLTNAPVGRLTTATLTNAYVRYAQVVFRITDGNSPASFRSSRPPFAATARKSS